MAKFLTTSGVTYHLEELIKCAQSKLYLISPYLKFNSRIREFLVHKASQKACDIRVVYGKTDLRPDESEWLNDSAIRTSYCDNLHAKCYLNEDMAIVTSMNLYDFSQQNNNEMGVLLTRVDDETAYQDLLAEAQRLLQISKEVRLSVEEVNEENNAKQNRGKGRSKHRSRVGGKKKRRSSDPGYCIGCGDDHPFNPDKPLCYTCYRNSSRGTDLEPWDRYCHACGDGNDSTLEKPLCYDCYKEYAA